MVPLRSKYISKIMIGQVREKLLADFTKTIKTIKARCEYCNLGCKINKNERGHNMISTGRRSSITIAARKQHWIHSFVRNMQCAFGDDEGNFSRNSRAQRNG